MKLIIHIIHAHRITHEKKEQKNKTEFRIECTVQQQSMFRDAVHLAYNDL